MRLRPKLVLMFIAALVLVLGLILAGYPPLADRVVEAQLFSLARTVGLYLVHDLEGLAFTGDEAAFETSVDRQLEFVTSLATTTREFEVRKIVLVRPDHRVEIAHPDSEIGADYGSHPDILAALGGAPFQAVIERSPLPGGGLETDADIVAPLGLQDGDRRAVEIKLDLSASKTLLKARYGSIQLLIGGVIALAFAALSGALLVTVSRGLISPLLRVSGAMEKVGSGDLGVSLGMARKDEIGAMAARFDEMVLGLRERFELSRYVSRSTFGAARARAGGEGSAEGGHVRRRRLTVFFSDVRGFTAYSEGTDPARVIEVLNRLLGLQEALISREGGDVDKFVGDETMAVFEDGAAALRAALAIREAAEAARADLDGLRLGMGIHSGDLVEGDIGSPDMMDHTVIGDTVNTAARIQAAAGPGEILVTASLAAERGVAGAFRFAEAPAVQAKGKREPVAVRRLEGRA